jgi:hypothetical protein
VGMVPYRVSTSHMKADLTFRFLLSVLSSTLLALLPSLSRATPIT